MKKLTAGIFSVLMGLVSVNAAEAAVASKGYVDAKIGDTGDQTVVEMINSVSSGSTQANTALAGRVTTAESEITTLKGDESVAGSVAQKIADAIGGLSADSVGAEGSFISTVSQADGTVTAGATPFVAAINDDSKTSTIAPQTKAVAAYVDAQLNVVNQANTEIAGKVGALEAAVTAEGALLDQFSDYKTANDAALEKEVQDRTAADTALGTRVGALEADNTTNKADITAIKAEQVTQNSDIDALQETVAKLDGTGDGSVAKQIETVTQKVTQVETEYKVADATLTQAIADGDTATLDAAKSYADQAEADAITTAGTNADTKISNLNLAALSRVPAECSSDKAYCVLTTNGTNFYWEAIERADGEEQPAGTAIPAVK